MSQLGSTDLGGWLDLVRTLWPGCPAQVSADGEYLTIRPAVALKAKEEWAAAEAKLRKHWSLLG